jgi:hypothetical protein
MIATIAKFFGINELIVKLLCGLGILLLVGLAVWRVVVWYDNQIDAAEQRGANLAYARVTDRVIDITGKLTDAADKIRNKANAKARTVTVAADDLRVRGPGKAACPAVAVTGSGGHVGTAGSADGAVAAVPGAQGSELIAVPFAVLVDFAEQHDKCLIEAWSWRENYLAQSKIVATERK